MEIEVSTTIPISFFEVDLDDCRILYGVGTYQQALNLEKHVAARAADSATDQ